MELETFWSTICSYHVFKTTSKSNIGDKLVVVRNGNNQRDRCAVSILKQEYGVYLVAIVNQVLRENLGKTHLKSERKWLAEGKGRRDWVGTINHSYVVKRILFFLFKCIYH